MMKISVILVEDNENIRSTLKTFLEGNDISVFGSFSHQEFIAFKVDISPVIALISFRKDYALTACTITHSKYYYKNTKIALLASVYDKITPKEIESLEIDGMLRFADDAILNMALTIAEGGKYFKND